MKHTDLWEQYKKTGDSGPLVEAYMGFAKSIALKVHKRLPSSVMYDDIECSALQGLWRAIERFDTTMSVPFAAYARPIVQGQIYDHIRESDNESRSLRSLQKQVEEAESRLSHNLHRPPNDSEIAAELDLPPETVSQCRSRVNNAHVWSLEASSDNDDYEFGGYGRNMIESGEKFHVPTDTYALFALVIAPWVKKERLLFALVYFEAMSLDKAAVILGIPHPQVCQMHYRMGEQLMKAINE